MFTICCYFPVSKLILYSLCYVAKFSASVLGVLQGHLQTFVNFQNTILDNTFKQSVMSLNEKIMYLADTVLGDFIVNRILLMARVNVNPDPRMYSGMEEVSGEIILKFCFTQRSKFTVLGFPE